MNDRPIFIGGLDRSGKTILRLALSAHPNLSLTRRTYMWPRFYQRFGDLSQKDNFERCLSALMKQKTIRQFMPDEISIRREFARAEPSYALLFALFHRQFAERIGKPRWGEQAGLIEKYTPAILEAFPAARIIHMVRDPRNRGEEILNSSPPAMRAGKIGQLTSSWLYSARLALHHQSAYPQNYKVVNYERLLSRPQETLIDICAFVGEDFIPEMLTFEKSIFYGEAGKELVNHTSLWEQDVIHFDLSKQKYLSPGEVVFLQAHAREEMEILGYQPVQVEVPFMKSMRLIVEWPLSKARMVTWHLFEARQVS